jgi:predicted DNA-binding WGR domain protein
VGESLTVESWLLNLTDERTNTDKFWRAYLVELEKDTYRVAFHWGRNGTKGSSRIETFGPPMAFPRDNARHAINKKLDEKKLKGYEVLRNARSAPDQAVLDLLGLTGVSVEQDEDTFAAFEAAANAAVRTLTGPSEEQDNAAVRQVKELFAELEQRYQESAGWMEAVQDMYFNKLEL